MAVIIIIIATATAIVVIAATTDMIVATASQRGGWGITPIKLYFAAVIAAPGSTIYSHSMGMKTRNKCFR